METSDAHDFRSEEDRLQALERARECLAFELATARAEAAQMPPFKPGPLEW